MPSLLPNTKLCFLGNDGKPLVGGKLYTYDTGTTTPRTTFQDAAGLVPNTNPVILDARGEALVFWNGSYRVKLTDSLDNLIWSVDSVSEIILTYRTSGNGSVIVPAGTTAERDTAPQYGYLRYNFDSNRHEAYTDVGWRLFSYMTSLTGSTLDAVGTTDQRDVAPIYGASRTNSTLNIKEWYNGNAWVAMGGGATGGGTDAIGVENDTFIAAPYTIGSAAILPCTISIASPCVITQANTYSKDQTVRFTSTGALPTGLDANGVYFVIATGLSSSSFQVSLTQGGAAVNTSGVQSGTHKVGKTKNMNVAGGITIGDAGGITIPTGCGIVIGG